MPLIRSGSKEAISTNIREMVHAGHPQRQAVAAALRTADKYRKKYAEGGDVDDGPAPDTFADRWGGLSSDKAIGSAGSLPRAKRQMATTQWANKIAGGLSEMGHEWAEGLKPLGDALQGNIPQPQDPSVWTERDQEARDRWAQQLQELGPATALGMMGTSTPFAKPGSLGTFGGKLAVTADHQALAKAERMTAAGLPRKQIWDETGWFQGEDKQWRFEIPDTNAKFKYAGDMSGWKLGDAIDHPELFEAYPWMKSLKLSTNPGYNSSYIPGINKERGSINIGQRGGVQPGLETEAVLHEMQHAVQRKEGFDPGSSPARELPIWNVFSKKARALAQEKYLQNKGEKEARNVEERYQDKDFAYDYPPWETAEWEGYIDLLKKIGASPEAIAHVKKETFKKYAEGGDVDDNTQEPPEKDPPADTFESRWGDMPSNRVRREEPNPARAMRQMAATQGFNQRAGEIGQRWLDDYYKVPGDILKGKYTPQPADPSLWSEYDQEARDRGAERLQELSPMIALSGVGASPALAAKARGRPLSGTIDDLRERPGLTEQTLSGAAPRAGSLEEAALNSYLQHSEPPSVTSRSPQERQLASEDYNRRMEEAADKAGLTGDKRAEFLDTGFVSSPGQSSVQARAAVKVGDHVYTGTIHADAYEKALAEHGEKKADTVENGWLLDDGRFLTADQLADQGLTARRQQVAEPPAASATPGIGADPADSVLSTLSADPKWKGKWKDDADEDLVWYHMRESYPDMADAQLQTIANEIKDRLKNGEFWHGTTRGRFTTFNEPTGENDVLGPAIYLSRHKEGAEFYGPGRGGDLLGPLHVRGNIVKPETMVPWEPGGQKMVPAINVLDKLKGQLDTGHREPWGNGMTPAQYTREFMKRRGIDGYDSGFGLEVAIYDPANIRAGFDPAPEAKQAQGKVGPPTRKRGGRIDRSKDVPLLAASNKKGGKTYIDKRIPKYIHAGKKLDTSKYLSIHEQTERSLMEKEKMNYAEAHKKATAAERAAVEKDGGDWKKYSEIMSGYVNDTEHEKNAKMPKDIYMKPYKQEGKAIAAMRTAKKLASGGDAGYFEHSAFRQLARPGMIHSPIPGRTDKIPMRVKGGSYVIPADVVSGAGQGNSMAGASALNKLFKAGPYGAGASRIATPNINYGHPAGSRLGFRPVRALADGGDDGAEDGEGNSGTADIVTAGGEYLVDPETVKRLGGGDMGHGHDILDEFVLHTRKGLVKTLKKLPGPKRS